MNQLYTKKQVADLLCVSTRSVTHLTTSGALPFVRIGRGVRVEPSDLAAFVASRKSVGRSSSHREPLSRPVSTI